MAVPKQLLFANHVFDVATTLPRQHALQSLTFLFRRSSWDDVQRVGTVN